MSVVDRLFDPFEVSAQLTFSSSSFSVLLTVATVMVIGRHCLD